MKSSVPCLGCWLHGGTVPIPSLGTGAHMWAAGELIYTRGEQGWRLLLAVRAERRPKVTSLAFEVWR